MAVGPHLSIPDESNAFHADYILRVVEAFDRVTGGDLVAEAGLNLSDLGRSAYFGAFALLTHRGDPKATLNYGNVFAQRLWDCDWDALIQMPSSLTAPEEDRADRDAVMRSVAAAGFARAYSGRRVSRAGRLFRIEEGTIWRLVDLKGEPFGVAAFFKKYSYL